MPSYRRRWKYEEDCLCDKKHNMKTRRQNSETSRYHFREYAKRFSKAERRNELLDLSSNVRPSAAYDARSVIRFIIDEVKDRDDKTADEVEDIQLHKIQQKTRKFNEQLRLKPKDESLWLEYVDFQDVAMAEAEFSLKSKDDDDGGDEEEVKVSKKKKKAGSLMVRTKAIVEKKLAILKTALDHNPKSVTLAVKRLELSKEILDSQTLDRQWKELIFLFPGNVQVWNEYLAFMTSHFTTFSLSKITEAFKSCFQKLKEMALDAFQQSQDLENQIANLVVRMCHLWARAGYRERAVALFQANIEINLFSPLFPGYYSLEDRLAMFEPFWESGVPRFGEPGAKGWAYVHKNKDNIEAIKAEAAADGGGDNLDKAGRDEEDQLISSFGGQVDEVQLWLKLEVLREHRHWLPWRERGVVGDDEAEDEDELEDPERSVLFDQLDGFLFQFRDPSSVFKLILCFLNFLGVDLDDEEFSTGSLGTQAFQEWLGISHSDAVEIGQEGILLEAQPGLDVVKDFIKNLFRQCISVTKEPFKTELILLMLKFEANHVDIPEDGDVKKAKKAKAKDIKTMTMSLLENDRNNTKIYIGYAEALLKLEGYKSAKKVFETALASKADRCDHELFTRAAILEMTSGKSSDQALWILSLLAKERPYMASNLNSIDLLAFAQEAKANLSEEIVTYTKPISSDDFKMHPVMWSNHFLSRLFCLSSLTLLLDGFEMADNVLSDKICDINDDVLKEALFKIRIDLMLLSAKDHARALVLAKTAISECLQSFPANPYVCSLLIKSRIDVRTAVSSSFWRSISKSLLSKASSASSPLGQLCLVELLINKFKEHSDIEEEHDNSIATGYLFKAWRILNDVVKTKPCRYKAIFREILYFNIYILRFFRTTPKMWRLLMWSTYMLGKQYPGKFNPKTIFYRALQDNPSAKILGLDLIHYQDNLSTNANRHLQSELQDIFTEKEVRIRMPMEELKVLLEVEQE